MQNNQQSFFMAALCIPLLQLARFSFSFSFAVCYCFYIFRRNSCFVSKLSVAFTCLCQKSSKASNCLTMLSSVWNSSFDLCSKPIYLSSSITSSKIAVMSGLYLAGAYNRPLFYNHLNHIPAAKIECNRNTN